MVTSTVHRVVTVIDTSAPSEVYSISSMPIKDTIFMSGTSIFITFVIISTGLYLLFCVVLSPCYKGNDKYNISYYSKEDIPENLQEQLIDYNENKLDYIHYLDKEIP